MHQVHPFKKLLLVVVQTWREGYAEGRSLARGSIVSLRFTAGSGSLRTGGAGRIVRRLFLEERSEKEKGEIHKQVTVYV